MTIQKYVKKCFSSLKGKTVAITGSTGGLGKAICKHLCPLGASLILLDRNAERSEALAEELRNTYGVSVDTFRVDHESMESVKAATEYLKMKEPDVLICNAGAYSIPRRVCDSGYDNVFQINFISPYYIYISISFSFKIISALSIYLLNHSSFSVCTGIIISGCAV